MVHIYKREEAFLKLRKFVDVVQFLNQWRPLVVYQLISWRKWTPRVTIRNQILILFKNTPYFNEMHIFISVNIYYLFTHKEEKNSYALK